MSLRLPREKLCGKTVYYRPLPHLYFLLMAYFKIGGSSLYFNLCSSVPPCPWLQEKNTSYEPNG